MDAAIAISIMARGRHHPVADPWPDIQLIQRIEQFQRSWFQGEASLGDHPKMAHPSFLELIDGECLAEVGQQIDTRTTGRNFAGLSRWPAHVPVHVAGQRVT